MKKFLYAAFAALFVFGLSACERETEIETTPGEPTEVDTDLEVGIPEEVEDDAEALGASMREGIGDAADAVQDGAREAGEAVEEGAERTGEAVRDAGQAIDDNVDLGDNAGDNDGN